jgi:hypothetical protein
VNGKMLVVFVKGTGHVLSAVTVATAPTRPLTSKDLVGDALPLWSVPGVPSTPGWSFGVPAEALDVAMIDPKQELLDSPFDWKIGSDNQPAQLQRIGSASPTIEKIEKPAGPKTLTATVSLPPPAPGLPPPVSGIPAVIFEQSGTDPVHFAPTETDESGVATVTYTGGEPNIVIGFVAEFRLAVKFKPWAVS